MVKSVQDEVMRSLVGRPNEWLRLGMVHLLPGVVPLYVVNEFPKSGGTWVGQMLGRALRCRSPETASPCCAPRSCTATTSARSG